VRSEQKELETRKNELLQNVPRNYHSEKDLLQAIKQKERSYQLSSSLSSKDEKALLHDIERLKSALPDMVKASEFEPRIADLRKAARDIQKQLDELKRAIEAKDLVIKEAKESNREVASRKDEVRQEASKFSEAVDAAQAQISSLFKQKDETREAYYKALLEWELQNDEVWFIKRCLNQQKRLQATGQERAERIAQRKAEIEAMGNPRHKHVAICDDLVAYCNKMRAQFGLIEHTSEEVARDVEKEMIQSQSQQEIDKKIKEGRLQMAVKKDEGLQVGGGRGKKGKKARKEHHAETAAFNIDITTINKFGIVMVSPPTNPDELVDKIAEITKKKAQLEETGAKELEEQKAEMLARVEAEVDAEIEKERREAALEEGEEEEEKKSDVYSRPPRQGGVSHG
jgi:ribosomal protein L15